jgi:predicted Na+-dependent transporter
MRIAIVLAILISIVTAIFAVQRSSGGEVDYQTIALVPIMLLAFAAYLYGARLADRDNIENPEKFRKFTGTTNVPIFQALFRASQAGDRAAMWSLAAMVCAPFLFGLLIVAPTIARRLLN